jgi:hypothetical protein
MGDGPPQLPGSEYNLMEGMMGNPLFGKPPETQRNETHDALMDALGMSTKLWKETEGMRGNVSQQLTDFTGGNYDVTSNPMFAPGKMATEDMYQTARDNVMSNMPAGGMMQENLTSLEGARLRGLTDTVANIQQDMFNKAYGAGYGTPQTSISGANQSANSMMQMLASQQAMASQNAQGMGALLGTMMSK